MRDALKKRIVRVETARTYEIVVDPANLPLRGKTAVVTGASGAIGRAIAVNLAMSGATVVGIARDRAKLDALVAEISAFGGQAEAHSVDLSATDDLRRLAADMEPIDILVNNAGGSSRQKNALSWEQTEATIDEILGVNLRAVIMTTALFGARMVEAGRGGRIVNLGSTVAVGGLARFSEYAAAKAGVVGFTRSAALEYGPHGITVNCVSPGIVQRGQISAAHAEATIAKAVLPRLGAAEDIAGMVGFLAGPGGEWITGQEFLVDGGRSIGLHGER